MPITVLQAGTEPTPAGERPLPTILAYDTPEEWHGLRHQDVTSTEVAALFGMSPYLTAFQLYHQKIASGPPTFEANERMKWGQRLEPVIACGVAEDMGWDIRPLKTYYRHATVPRLGASFDYMVMGLLDQLLPGVPLRADVPTWAHGPGLMEVKNVDGLQFRHGWAEEDGQLEAPPHIEIQLQAQMEVADVSWGVIVALVGGNQPQLLFRQRDTLVGATIRQAVTAFWGSVDFRNPPAPEFTRDAEFICRLHGFSEPGSLLETDDQGLVDLCAQYKAAGAAAKAAEEDKQRCKAQLLQAIGTAEKVVATASDGVVFKISSTMIGPAEIHYTREGYRDFRITVSQSKVGQPAGRPKKGSTP